MVPKVKGFHMVIYCRVSPGCPGYYAAVAPMDLASLGVLDVVSPGDLDDLGPVTLDDVVPLSVGVRDSLTVPPGESEGGDRALWDARGCGLPVAPVSVTMEVHRARDRDPVAGCLVERPLVVAVTLIPAWSVRLPESEGVGTVRHRLQKVSMFMLCSFTT